MLADKPGFSRTALARVLEETPGVTLMRVTAGDDQLVAAVAELRPDVLVVDDRLLHHGHPLPADTGVRVLVVGVDDDPAFAARAEQLGAVAWIAKERADLLLSGLFEAT